LFKEGIYKLRGINKGYEEGRCPLCSKEEDDVHVLLKCPEATKLREHLLSKKKRRLMKK
jgi:hypothetical protein